MNDLEKLAEAVVDGYSSDNQKIWPGILKEWVLSALQTAVKAERERWRKYADHMLDCDLSRSFGDKCTCGLGELLEEETK